MYLKTLEIRGFKSFADAATLELEPGVTVVVGPNGSGKSNVVDAIGWVLGAQRPSAIRSQKMDDVIFAGSAKRPALGRSEVALTIDNASGMLPIDFTEVTISRTLFRSGDSEYSLNGVPCRLLDIQELLSDTGVGRQQHVIISQGQIDAVLNAKPEDRRLIIEEAAGVLKYRRRKEKSERRLASTEANLLRIQDLLREVRRQLRPLERQADAAQRHGALVEETRSLQLHVLGRELARQRRVLAESGVAQTSLKSTDREIRAELATLDAQVLATEADLSAAGGVDVSDALVRYESLRERALGVRSLLAERQRGIERDRRSFVDEAVVASLEAEAAEVRHDLAALDVEAPKVAAAAAELNAAESDLVVARARFESEWGTPASLSLNEAAEVRGELAALEAAMERSASDLRRVESRRGSLAERTARLTADRDRYAADHADHVARAPQEEAAAAAAATAHDAAQDRLVAADEGAHQAAGEHRSWQARAEALELALDEARQGAGAEKVAGIDGVLGTLQDVVDVDEGWDAAFEAAAGDAMRAVVVDSPRAGRAALDALTAADLGGAVLPPVGTPGAALPTGLSAMRDRVRATHGGVDSLLDNLLSGVVAHEGTWRDAIDVALQHPTLHVVTRDGARFGSLGWRVGAQGSVATRAALDEARRRADEAGLLADETGRRLIEARTAERTARDAATETRRDLDAFGVRLTNLGAALERTEADLAEALSELETTDAHLGELKERVGRETGRHVELSARIPALEAAEAEADERARRESVARRELEERSETVGALRTDVEVKVAGVEERRRFLRGRMEQLDIRLQRHAADRAGAEQRLAELDARAEVTAIIGAFVADRLTDIDDVLGGLRDARRAQSERTRAQTVRLDELRRERSAAEKRLEEVRERLQRAEIADAETRIRLEAATAQARDELDVEPEVAMSSECPELPEGASPQGRLRELERELRLMGPINPLALEEFTALSERHEFLQGQLDDIRHSRRELTKIITAVDEEIVKVFSAAYADVSENFGRLFETLFPGGQGSLSLTEPSNLLETGIEISARPSGKNVRKLSLLSGGERSLTALAYLFAIFRSRPSPFYVMDEVEAALDDVNLHRFLNLVAEFRSTAQLVIVSHQKRTMEAADVLYGVTMEPGGSSKVLSERVGATDST